MCPEAIKLMIPQHLRQDLSEHPAYKLQYATIRLKQILVIQLAHIYHEESEVR